MSSIAQKLMSLEEFLAWEREQPERYEYTGGVTRMTTGGSLDHSTIASNLWTALRDGLRGSGCRAFRGDSNLWTALRDGLRGSGCRAFRGDAKVIANNSVRYPDLSVTCVSVRGNDDIVLDPVLLIEIVSPSTEREDRGRKKFDYFATPSVQQYALIEQDERRIDLYTRAGREWTNEIIEGDVVLKLSSIGVEVSLDAIYEDTEVDATRPREGEPQAPAL